MHASIQLIAAYWPGKVNGWSIHHTLNRLADDEIRAFAPDGSDDAAQEAFAMGGVRTGVLRLVGAETLEWP